MRHQGRITTWKDDRGFGFITPDPIQPARPNTAPNASGSPATAVFLHISAIVDRSRPSENDRVEYTLDTDQHGRPRATAVTRVARRTPGFTIPTSVWWVVATLGVVALLIASGMSIGTAPDHLPGLAIAGLYVVASTITYLVYALDKSAAQRGDRRTPERTLHLLALIGGWPGALAAQRRLRHKSSKRAFQTVFRATVVVNVAALFWLLTPDGQTTLEALLKPLG